MENNIDKVYETIITEAGVTTSEICEVKVNDAGYEMATHGTIKFPIASYATDIAVMPVTWHWHNELEMILVSAGEGIIYAGNEKYVVHSGQGVIINAGAIHQCTGSGNDKNCRIHSIVFHPRIVGGSIDSIYYNKYVEPIVSNKSFGGIFLNGEDEWTVELLNNIILCCDLMNSRIDGYELQIRETLSKSMSILKEHITTDNVHISDKNYRDSERLKVMLTYIKEHFMEEITTLDIASSAAISVSECLRCFNKNINTTPMQYTIEYRMHKAAKLLEETDMKVVEIGSNCGFSDMSYFSKKFKSYFGQTPMQYRNTYAI